MELPKEWRDIAANMSGLHNCDAISVVERCYKLHSKPPKELTDDECYKLWVRVYRGPFRTLDWAVGIASGTDVVRAIIAADRAKQKEPETVTFRAARSKRTGSVVMCNALETVTGWNEWEWLDIDGKPQEFTVRIS